MSKRIVSRRELSLWVVTYLTAVAVAIALAVVMFNSPAHAASRRDVKHVVEKRDYWSMIRNYSAPNQVGFGTHIESYTVSVAVNYLYWPNGSANPNQMAVTGGSVCYQRNTGNGSLFQGVAAHPVTRDNTFVADPGQISVDDDGTGYNCDPWNIPSSQRGWFQMSQDPLWFSTGKVRIKFEPDDNFQFLWGGLQIKYFDPPNDTNVGNWYDCTDCNWGNS